MDYYGRPDESNTSRTAKFVHLKFMISKQQVYTHAGLPIEQRDPREKILHANHAQNGTVGMVN